MRTALVSGWLVACALAFAAACGSGSSDDVGADGDGGASEASVFEAAAGGDGSAASDSSAIADSATQDSPSSDAASQDAASQDAASQDAPALDASSFDALADAGPSDAKPSDSAAGDSSSNDSSVGGVITGGPCASGAPGATAFRIKFVDAGGQAQIQYLVEGLPDHAHETAGVYGYQIGFTPAYVDPYLAQGGLQLDDSDFIDLQLSTAGVSSITTATLAIYGRSYNTTTSGSFNWQTLVDTGSTATDSVSNVAPYQWYQGDATSAINANNSNMLIRIKAGPSSDALVVNEVELCLQAQ